MPKATSETRKYAPKFGELYETEKPIAHDGTVAAWKHLQGFLIKDSHKTKIKSTHGEYFWCTVLWAGEAPGRSHEIQSISFLKKVIVFVEAIRPYNKVVFIPPSESIDNTLSSLESANEIDVQIILENLNHSRVVKSTVLYWNQLIETLRYKTDRETGDFSKTERGIEWFRSRELSLLSCMQELINGYARFSLFTGNRIKSEHQAAIFSYFSKTTSGTLALSPITFWNSFRSWNLNTEFEIIDGSNLISRELRQCACEVLRMEDIYPKAINGDFSSLVRRIVPIDWKKREELPIRERYSIPLNISLPLDSVEERIRNLDEPIYLREAEFYIEKFSDKYWLWTLSLRLDETTGRDSTITFGCGWIERQGLGFIRRLLG